MCWAFLRSLWARGDRSDGCIAQRDLIIDNTVSQQVTLKSGDMLVLERTASVDDVRRCYGNDCADILACAQSNMFGRFYEARTDQGVVVRVTNSKQ